LVSLSHHSFNFLSLCFWFQFQCSPSICLLVWRWRRTQPLKILWWGVHLLNIKWLF
jgi:hypothetical protein